MSSAGELDDTGLLLADADGRVVHASPEALHILQLDATPLGRPLDEVLAPLLDDASSPAPAVSWRRARALEHEVVLLRSTSEVITARREREKLLRLATLSEIMPSLMHQVRNPLASAIASLEVLVEELSIEELRADLLEVVGEIRRAAQSLRGVGDMTRDLRTVEHHRLAPAIEDGVATLRANADSRNVRIDVAPIQLSPLPLEPSVIRAMVFHLASNAIAACPNGGHVQIDARLRREPPDREASELLLSIEDDGVGMDETELAHCCDLFFTTKLHGSGLGLPLCRHAVEAAGGTLEVTSRRGVGTRVEIRVPLEPALAL